jgi:hypothetical protein
MQPSSLGRQARAVCVYTWATFSVEPAGCIEIAEWQADAIANAPMGDKKIVRVPKGVTIGAGARIGAGAVVSGNVPDFAVVAGNPARLTESVRP